MNVNAFRLGSQIKSIGFVTLLSALFQNCSGPTLITKIGRLSPAKLVARASGADGSITFGNDILQLTATPRLAFAVEEMTFNGKQFLDHSDHGREMQSAFWNNGKGGCENPTQAGSGDDSTGPTSSSVMIAQSPTDDSLTSAVYPAYWFAPGEACDGTGGNTVMTKAAMDQPLTTVVTVGVDGDEQVIHYVATISNQHAYQSQLVTFGSAMTSDFNQSYVYSPTTGKLEAYAVNVMSWETLPPVVATADGQYAVGIIASDVPGVYASYSISQNGVAGIGLSLNYGAIAAGDLTQDAYIVVGTLADVEARMPTMLAKVHTTVDPTIFDRAFYSLGHSVAPDDQSATGALANWQTNQTNDGVRASAVYDPRAYSQYNQSLVAGVSRQQMLFDYIRVNQANGLRASLEFDPAYYLANNPDVAAAVSNDPKQASEHWQMTGIDEGRAGSADFDPRAYLARYADLQSAFGANGFRRALYHWILKGKAAGRIGTTTGTVVVAPAQGPMESDSVPSVAAPPVSMPPPTVLPADPNSAAVFDPVSSASVVPPAASTTLDQSVSPPPTPPAARSTRTVYRYNSSRGHLFALSADGNSILAGYQLEGAVFNVYSSGDADFLPLWRCNSGGRQFLSVDQGCEGATTRGLLGYVASGQGADLQPLYRLVNDSGDHLEDTSPDQYASSGYAVEGVLGYVP